MTGTQEIIFVTGNANKLAEVNAMLQDTLYRVTNIALDLEEVQGSLDEVSISKCKAASELIKGPVLVEDTALCFDALKELPGPYIKWFMKAIGHDGLNRMLAGFDDKGAKAVCTFAFTEGPGHQVKLFRGTTPGSIVPARGDNNFGWDPIFEPKGYSETYAEMDKAVKNKISHRSKALKLLVDFLEKRVNEKP